MLGLVEPFVHLEWRRVRELVEPLQRAKDTIAELRAQNENLKEQVRVEVERRAKLEEELLECEGAQAENLTLRDEVARLRGTAEDAGRLVKSSRRLQRQQADQVLVLKAENTRLLAAKGEVVGLEAEVDSLRALVSDKDEAMQRQVRTMDALKELVQRLRAVHPGVNDCIEEFFQSATSEDGEDDQDDPGGVGREAERRRQLGGSGRRSGAGVRVSSRSSTGQPRSVSVTSNRSADPERRSQAASHASNRDARAASPADARTTTPQALSKKRLDAIASLYLQLGSRVVVDVQGVPEPGTVKYIGLAHGADPDRVFVGVRLHSPQGNTDGTYKGVRYFTAPHNCGLFLRAQKILSVFNPKKNSHASMNDCVKAYLKMHQ